MFSRSSHRFNPCRKVRPVNGWIRWRYVGFPWKSWDKFLTFQMRYDFCFAPCSRRRRAFFSPVFWRNASPRIVPTKISRCCVDSFIHHVYWIPSDFPRYYEESKTLCLQGKTAPHFTVISRTCPALLRDWTTGPYFRAYPRGSFYPLIFDHVLASDNPPLLRSGMPNAKCRMMNSRRNAIQHSEFII